MMLLDTYYAPSTNGGVWKSRPTTVLWATVACAALFEAVTVLATQLKSVRAHGPWQDDPYNVMVSFALFVVPVLAVMLVARLASRRSHPTDAATATLGDAERQMLRAALALIVVIDATLIAEWASVLRGAHRAAWNAATGGLLVGAAATTLCAAALTALLLHNGAARRLRRQWNEDWLGDYASLLDRVRGVGRLNLTAVVTGVRRHAVLVFATASLAGAAAIIGALAYSEGWTDPALFGWALAVETSSNFCACMIINAVAGVVARPEPGHPRLEVAVVAGCVAVQFAVAFRELIWKALTGRSADTLPALAGVTGGAAVLACAVALVVTAVHRRRTAGMGA
jgi:hypothetical protein